MIDSPVMETKVVAPANQQTNEISDVVRHLAHELRQPLSTIETAAYYLEMVLGRTDARVSGQVEKIQQMVAQINWMLSDTLHFMQGPAPHPLWIDLARMIEEILETCDSQGFAEVRWNAPSVAPHVYMDPSQAHHLICSALTVFRQLADSGQTVSLSLIPDGQMALFTCACAAPMNLPDCSDDPFTLFHSPRPTGTGLALASVRRIAESNGGDSHLFRDGEYLKLIVRLPGR
jgi:signal transduction histidine kinase